MKLVGESIGELDASGGGNHYTRHIGIKLVEARPEHVAGVGVINPEHPRRIDHVIPTRILDW